MSERCCFVAETLEQAAVWLGDQFLPRIAVGRELDGQVAGKPPGMAGPVAKLMESRAVVVDLIAEGGLRRDADGIELRA